MAIQKAAYGFLTKGEPLRCRPFGRGNINSTFLLTTDAGVRYILQKINTFVFRQPVQLMANAGAVTEHIRRRVSDPRLVLHFIPSAGGLPYYKDSSGEFWRMYDYIGGITPRLPCPEHQLHSCALAFGRFCQLLADFPAETLFETIPDFHNTPLRLQQLEAAAAADPAGRLRRVQPEVEAVLSRRRQGCLLQQYRRSGQLPLRVTHNDTKLDNVLLDSRTNEGLCVLDLDTVMPGLSAYDFGDCIRSAAATAAEDAADLQAVRLDPRRFTLCARGFLQGAPALTRREVDALSLGVCTITLELAARFLTDYLQGDPYFKTDFPEHNLIRARNQLALLQDMEHKWEFMQQTVGQCAADLRC